MKKIAALFATFLMTGVLFAQIKVIDKENGYFIYLKGSNTKITDAEYLNYAKVVERDTYDKYRNDEFEWEEQFGKLKNKFNESITNADLETTYTVVTAVEFGDYNFTNEGFPVSIGEGTFFPFNRITGWSEASDDSVFTKSLALKLDSFEKYNFFAMPKADAKKFLQGRKNRYGNVDREVSLQISYKLAAFDSKEYKSFKDLALANNYLPLVGIIEKIEVYDASDRNKVKKISELVKK